MNILKQQTEVIIFKLVKEDVFECAQEMGIPADAITNDILEKVKKNVEWGLECRSDVVKEAIKIATNN